MAIFTAIAAAVVSAIGITGTAATIFTAIGATVLSVGASRLLMKRQMRGANSGGDGSARIQLPPATENKIPVVYGSAYIGGSVTDAKISSDNQTMWYCVTMAEVTDTGGYTFDTSNIYYNGLKVQFGSQGVVTGLINNTTPATLDTKMSGQIYIYLFQNGATSPGQNTTQTAQQIMQDSEIPAGQRWTATDLMSDVAFAIVKVKYNAEKGTTSLGGLTARITNSLSEPGDVINDYMQNTRYGCAIPAAQIDSASLTELNVYSDYDLPYTLPGGGAATQKRYRINGPLATGTDCLTNLQILVDSCDSWLQYSEFLGQWRVIINQSYTDYTTIDALYLVDDNNLVGGINVAPINLNETFNQLEVAYPNESVRDQTDYQLIELEDYAVGVMSPNEATNKLDVDFPVVNTSVQSVYLGIRRLLQSREDLTITLQLDYSGIQVEAGDVIRVKNEVYGWDVLNGSRGKLFRVANVAEEKYQDGSLGVRLTALEYNDTIYADFALTAYQPDPNTGIENPNFISQPEPPRFFISSDGEIAYLNITGQVPDTGLVTNLDFNYGNTTDVETHVQYTTLDSGNGAPLTSELNTSQLLIGSQYTIRTLGATAWATIGAQVIDLSTQPATTGFLTPGVQYIIAFAGTTDFISAGASSNAAGTIFTANQVNLASGTGIAIKTDFIATGTDAGGGTVDTTFTIQMNDLPGDTYYWSVRAKNNQQGVTSVAAGPIVWPGPDLTAFKSTYVYFANSVGTTVTYTVPNYDVCLGGNVSIEGGVGEFLANTYITSITSNVEFELNQAPSTALATANVQVTCLNYDNGNVGGGHDANTITDGTITDTKLDPNLGMGRIIAQNVWGVAQFSSSGSPLPPLLPVLYAVNAPSITTTGISIPNTEYYPYRQGTSSTTHFYLTNSSAAYTPSDASQLRPTSGDDDWYSFADELIYGGFRPNRDIMDQTGVFHFVSDSDCDIQITPYLRFSASPGNFVTNTNVALDTIPLKANQPFYYEKRYRYSSIGSTGLACGFMWRVLQTGPIVICDEAIHEAKVIRR